MLKMARKSQILWTNHLGQFKIASADKTRKWIWVNAKKYQGYLKRRIACFKWEQRRRKQTHKRKKRRATKIKKSQSFTVPRLHLLLGH